MKKCKVFWSPAEETIVARGILAFVATGRDVLWKTASKEGQKGLDAARRRYLQAPDHNPGIFKLLQAGGMKFHKEGKPPAWTASMKAPIVVSPIMSQQQPTEPATVQPTPAPVPQSPMGMVSSVLTAAIEGWLVGLIDRAMSPRLDEVKTLLGKQGKDLEDIFLQLSERPAGTPTKPVKVAADEHTPVVMTWEVPGKTIRAMQGQLQGVRVQGCPRLGSDSPKADLVLFGRKTPSEHMDALRKHYGGALVECPDRVDHAVALVLRQFGLLGGHH